MAGRTALCLIALALTAACDPATIAATADGFQRGYGNGPPQPPQSRPPRSSTYLAAYTGQSRQVPTVTGQMTWQCEYQYAGQTFILTMKTYCPHSVPVQ